MKHRKSLVVLEEDSDMRSLMRYLLENAGFKVIALQGDSFLIERIGRFNPDVVLIDLPWPPSERLTLINQLRKSVTFSARAAFWPGGEVDL
jgi:DNA-binding response OmpR family regulator